MLKKSIGIGLMALSAQSFANIQVTTTDDTVKDDSVCSLREAVTYVNDIYSDSSKKLTSYYGCGGTDNSTLNNVIELEPDKNYTLTSELQLKQPITIQTRNSGIATVDKQIGTHNATIIANGQHRLFNIDDGRADISQIAVSLLQLNLQGCGVATCAQQGGLIFNRENLSMQYAKLSKGNAVSGGAIYNAGLVVGNNASSTGYVNLNKSILQQNTADNGAALYTEQPLYQISNSVIRDNVTNNANGAVLYSMTAFDDATTSTTNFLRTGFLINSTLFGNSGYLMNLRDGLYANNVTAIRNKNGFYLDAPNGKAHIANSIVVDNGTDCSFSSSNTAKTLNNLVGSTTTCGSGQTDNPNLDWSQLPHNKLIAGTQTESSSCDAPPADGLLCPFNTPKDSFLGFFRPRLLSSYTRLSDSPIVNRGRLYSDGTSMALYSCQGDDQRGLSRSNSIQCDLGAIELLVSPENVDRVGQDLLYGQTATLDISNNLADGQLLPAADCKAALGTDKDPNGQPWKDGCLRVEQSLSTPTSKGSLILKADGSLTYAPNGNWHGLDDFNLRVVTTASRFSDAISDRDILIPVRIVQSPPNDFVSKEVKVKGGAIGGFGVLGLLVLAWQRRKLNTER